MSKYRNAFELCDEMTRSNRQKRKQTCEEILKEKHLWALDYDEFNIKNEMQTTSKYEFNKNLFIYSIFASILMRINEKKMKENNKSKENFNSMKEIESLIMDLMRFYDIKCNFVEKYLHHLFKYTKNISCEPNEDMINLTVFLLEKYSKIISIQWNGISCLYNLTQDDLAEKLDQKILENVIDVTITALEAFPGHQRLHETVLSILCKDRILNFYDIHEIIRLLINSLIVFQDSEIFISICSYISNKISINEYLPSLNSYIETLLDIVRKYIVHSLDNDSRLDDTLLALWSLSYSSPESYEIFLEKGGLDLYMHLLKVSS